ncbi:MAG: DUF285 domain-containing protein [Clostridia bacterium]|nr:DUF285 domain-containing protein [Clostridia bacterium]
MNIPHRFLINKKISNSISQHPIPLYVPKSKDELKLNIKELLKKKIHDLNYIDISNITDMSYLFCKDGKGVNIDDIDDIDISLWDVSNVRNMHSMFNYCKNFNCDISNWNVGKVEDMGYMFSSCYNFNCDISKWDVSNVKNMNSMFDECRKFNQNLNNWDVDKVEDMSNAFYDCISLKNKPNWYH